MKEIEVAAQTAQSAILESVRKAADKGPSKSTNQTAYKKQDRRTKHKMGYHTANSNATIGDASTPTEQENRIKLIQDSGTQYQGALKDDRHRIRNNQQQAQILFNGPPVSIDVQFAKLREMAIDLEIKNAHLRRDICIQNQRCAQLESEVQNYQTTVKLRTEMLDWTKGEIQNLDKLLDGKKSIIAEKDSQLSEIGSEIRHTQSELRRAQKDVEYLRKRDLLDHFWDALKAFFDAPPPSRKTLPFLRLPAELRIMVYKDCLVVPRPIDLWPILPHDAPKGFSRLTVIREDVSHINASLLRVCRQINEETIPILYGCNRFRFSDRGGWTIMDGFFRHIGLNVSFLTNIAVTCPAWAAAVIETTVPDLRDEMRRTLLRFGGAVLDAPGGPSSEFNFAYKSAGIVLLQLKNLKSFSIVIRHDMRLEESTIIPLCHTLTEDDDFMLPTPNWEMRSTPRRSMIVIRRSSRQPVFVAGHNVDNDIFMRRWELYLRMTLHGDENLSLKTAKYGTSRNRLSYVVEGGEDEGDVQLPVVKDYRPPPQEGSYRDFVGTMMLLMCLTYIYKSTKG
jgi:hypothetical protein